MKLFVNVSAMWVYVDVTGFYNQGIIGGERGEFIKQVQCGNMTTFLYH